LALALVLALRWVLELVLRLALELAQELVLELAQELVLVLALELVQELAQELVLGLELELAQELVQVYYSRTNTCHNSADKAGKISRTQSTMTATLRSVMHKLCISCHSIQSRTH
jgi:hypothetical protein